MKTFGKIIGILLGIVAVLIIGLVLFLKYFDWDRARPFINEKVSDATGRRFEIAGHLTAQWRRPAGETGWRSLIPWPTFTAENLRIDNPDWAKRRQFATADAVTVEVELLPLLAHEIIIPRIALRNPVVDLERTLDAQNTWTFKRSDKAKSKWHLQLQELAFADGIVDVTDQPTKIDLRATIKTIGKPIALGDLLARQSGQPAAPADRKNAAPGVKTAGKNPDNTASTAKQAAKENAADNAAASAAQDPAGSENRYGFGVGLAGTYRGAKLTGTGKIGGALSLVDSQRPFPLQADVQLGDNHLTAVGTLTDPAKLGAVDLQLTLAASSMSDLYDLLGVALPETPKFHTQGHLTGNLNKPARHVKYEGFAGLVGRSDLAGSLEFDATRARPRLIGNINSKRLVLADLGPTIGAQPSSRTAKAPGGAKAPAGKGGDRALPTTTFRTDRWRAMDIDVKFAGASIIRSDALPLSDMSTHVIMNDGVLTFDPLKFGVAGGTITGTMRLDGQRQPLDGKLDIAARHLQLKRLFPKFQPMNTSFGEVNGDAKLTGKGNSSAALAATANGEVKLLVNDGAISNTLLEEAGLNVANIVAAKLFGEKTVHINCAAADFVVKNGVLDSRVFALDTTDALINVDGDVNLGSEQMALNVYPHTKGFRIFSLRSPLYVRGTFKKPDVGVMVGPLAVRGAAALALGAVAPMASLLALLVPSTKEASPCPTMLATAREPIKGAPAVKH